MKINSASAKAFTGGDQVNKFAFGGKPDLQGPENRDKPHY